MCLRLALVAIAFVLIGLQPLGGADADSFDVIVRVYDEKGAGIGDRRQALDLAAATLASALVDVRWRPCTAGACDTARLPGEFTLRMAQWPGAPRPGESAVLGQALIDREARVGLIATVYIDRIRWLAAKSEIDYRTLLGRVVAHELGHLLLADGRHAAVGLMRPLILPHDVRRNQPRDWSFTPGQAAAIAARLDVTAVAQSAHVDADDRR